MRAAAGYLASVTCLVALYAIGLFLLAAWVL